MKKIDLGQKITILANLAVLVGIAFLAIEIRQNTTVARLSVIQSYGDNLNELSYFIAGDQEFATLVAENASDFQLTPEALRLSAFWSAQLREWDTAYRVLTTSSLDPELERALIAQISAILQGDRDVYNWWKGRTALYTDSFNALMEEIAQELELE